MSATSPLQDDLTSPLNHVQIDPVSPKAPKADSTPLDENIDFYNHCVETLTHAATRQILQGDVQQKNLEKIIVSLTETIQATNEASNLQQSVQSEADKRFRKHRKEIQDKLYKSDMKMDRHAVNPVGRHWEQILYQAHHEEDLEAADELAALRQEQTNLTIQLARTRRRSDLLAKRAKLYESFVEDVEKLQEEKRDAKLAELDKIWSSVLQKEYQLMNRNQEDVKEDIMLRNVY